MANISLRVSQVYGEQTACLIMMKGNVLKAGKTKKRRESRRGLPKELFIVSGVTKHLLCTHSPDGVLCKYHANEWMPIAQG